MNTVQIANYPPVSIDELRAAGIQWHPQRGLGAMPNWMPITREDRDHLGEVRNKKLNKLRKLAIIAIFLSVVSIVIGICAIATSAPIYNFPHCLGGGIIIGVVVIIYSILILAMVNEGQKTPTGDTTTSCFRCLTTCNTLFTVFFSSAAMVAVGMSGIWATVECAERTPKDDDTGRFSFNGCTPNTGGLFALAVLTLLVGLVLFVLFLTMNCMICCNYRAFGVKSNYEMFADYQMLRMQQMNLQAQQQQQSFLPQQGQGQFPVQGYPYPQGQYQQSPSAPMLPQHQGFPPTSSETAQSDDAPPSYRDVMTSGKYQPT